MVEDGSIDLVFSLDSLVHVEQNIITAYLAQLPHKLAPNGVDFIHHSNLGAYKPRECKGEDAHRRGTTVSASLFEKAAQDADLRCISREQVTWGGKKCLIDCMSAVTRPGSIWDTDNAVVEN